MPTSKQLTPREVRHLVRQLGGPKCVSKKLGITSQAVSHWRVIPVEHCPRIESMAREAGLTFKGEPYVCELFQPKVAWSELRTS